MSVFPIRGRKNFSDHVNLSHSAFTVLRFFQLQQTGLCEKREPRISRNGLFYQGDVERGISSKCPSLLFS